METTRYLPYGCPSISEEDRTAASQALLGPVITRGPHVEAFENAIAEYCGAKYAVAFNSGTAALHAACQAAELNAQDRCFVTPNTFVATAGAAIRQGTAPIFIDITRTTGNMDLGLLEHNLHRPASRGRDVIMPVHFSGIPFNTPELNNLIRHPETLIIEDAAHALGSLYPNGDKIGSCLWSDMTIFSFHPVKTITTGEGGMVTTNSEKLYERLKLFRNNGILRKPNDPAWKYEVLEISGNYNVTESQAALGTSQLSRISSFIEKRRALVKHYRKLFKENLPEVKLFTEEYDAISAFHLFVVQIPFAKYKTDRAQLMQRLHEQGIGSQLHYIPLYQHPYFIQRNGEVSEYFPEMEGYFGEAMSLPLYYDLTTVDVERVVKTLKKQLTKK